LNAATSRPISQRITRTPLRQPFHDRDTPGTCRGCVLDRPDPVEHPPEQPGSPAAAVRGARRPHRCRSRSTRSYQQCRHRPTRGWRYPRRLADEGRAVSTTSWSGSNAARSPPTRLAEALAARASAQTSISDCHHCGRPAPSPIAKRAGPECSPVRSAMGVTDSFARASALARGGLGVARPPLQIRSARRGQSSRHHCRGQIASVPPSCSVVPTHCHTWH